MRSRFSRLALAAALLAPVPALAQGAPPATPAPVAATVDADPALWVLRDADTTIYLFGTVHALRPGLSWFDEAVADAFNAAGELRIETEVPENPADLAPLIGPLATNSPGTLTSRMTEAQRSAYIAGAERIGLPWQQLEPVEAWLVSLQLAVGLMQRANMRPELGADNVLKAAARQRGIRITTFETAEEQLRMFDSVPESEQITAVIELMANMDAGAAMLDQIKDAWIRGDAEATGAIITATRAAAPEMHRIIFIDRNRRWADAIVERLREPGTVFVAVGAGHLAGEGSVQDFLRERGITVDRIAY